MATQAPRGYGGRGWPVYGRPTAAPARGRGSSSPASPMFPRGVAIAIGLCLLAFAWLALRGPADLPGHRDMIFAAAFSPDGSALGIGDASGNVLDEGLLYRFPVPDGPVQPDERYLVLENVPVLAARPERRWPSSSG